MFHYLARRFVFHFFGRFLGQQCSGKYRSGYAKVYCQKRLGHDDECVDYAGIVFSDGTAKEVRSE